MSDYTRYLLNSAGINATEQDIEAIDSSGYPEEIALLLPYFMAGVSTESREIQPGVWQHIFTSVNSMKVEFIPNTSHSYLLAPKMHARLCHLTARAKKQRRAWKRNKRQRRAAQRRHDKGLRQR